MKLPPIPEPNGYDSRHTEEQVREVQIAAARAALEEAARICLLTSQGKEWDPVLLRIYKAIRATKIEG